ncbi:hypothetical protein BT96DRAFT_924666 [Gymnopus androsaceus JB14]|uniref:Uncharacterized protein n=1 Tax=Gymnopus androsaceus JB14 TaxID=1447944 RepID=A0A6A4H447_9AGAR|nr:hypothetical protein BT96DRAFT_924666 [Gymnopus androsaceus JB14]
MANNVQERWTSLVPSSRSEPTASPQQEELRRLQTLLSREMAKTTTFEGVIRELHASVEQQARSMAQKHLDLELRATAVKQELDRQAKEAAANQEVVAARIAELERTVGDLKESLVDANSKENSLSQRVRELEDIDTTSIQKSIIEHANIHILTRLFSVARDDFESGEITQMEMLQACDNLVEQLKEVAARQLERAPVGFSSIDNLMQSKARRTWEDVGKEEDESVVIIDQSSSKRPRV